jgi:cellulose synthase operon protein C
MALSLAIIAALHFSGCSSPDERAQTHYERGARLLAQNEFAKAGIEFKSALRLKQNLVPAWQGLAQIEERNQNWEALASIFKAITEHDPSDVETRMRYARLMLIGAALDESLKSVNAVLERDQRHASALALKAAILLKLNDVKGAIENATASLASQPDGIEPLIVLAAERHGREDAQGALAVLSRVPPSQVENVSVQLFKVKIYEKLGDTAQMEKILRRLADVNANVPAYRAQLIQFYVAQKRNDDAEKELRAIATGNPSDHEAGLNLVRFLASTKGLAAAQQELVARINSGGSFHYRMALADSHLSAGNKSESLQLLQQMSAEAGLGAQRLVAQSRLAELHLGDKKLEAAEELITSILKSDGRNIDGLRLRAAVNLERGQTDPAIADLRQALNDQPRNFALMLLLAVAYERSGSMELADKQYADALRASSFATDAGMTYVGFLRRRGNLSRAEDVLIEMAGRMPNSVEVLTALGDVRLTRQNWLGAQEVAEAIKRLGNDRGVASQISAASLAGRQKFDDGIRILYQAHNEAPEAAQPIYALVNTMVRARQFERAVAFVRTILDKTPDNAELRVLLGSTQLAMGAADQALLSYRAAIAAAPKNLVGYRALADYNLRANKPADALGVVRSALQIAPDDTGLRLMQASILETTGEYDRAIEEYEALLKIDSGSLVVVNNLASLLSDHRSDKASLDRAHAISGVLRKTQVPQFKDTLGWIHYRRGEYKAAIALLEEAVAELPDHAEVRFHLGMAHLAAGEPNRANEQFKKAIEKAAGGSPLEGKLREAMKKSGT